MVNNELSAMRYQPKSAAIRHNNDVSLKGYLKEVSTLEVQVYNQKRIIMKLTQKVNCLGEYKDFREPRKPSFSLYNLLHTTNYFCVTFLAIAIAVLIVFSLASLAFVAISGFLIFICLAMIPDYLDYRSAIKHYRKDMVSYNNSVSADMRRVEHELLVKTEVEYQIKHIKAELLNTQRVLESVYAIGVLHPSYRNLVAVCSFHDYFDKGICTKLTGHSGAYAFYEEELRFRRIETRLDVIISKLDEIIANQHQLASLIKDGNAAIYRIEQQNNHMISTLDTICENTAVTEYNTRCAAQSAAVMESIAIYRTLKYD